MVLKLILRACLMDIRDFVKVLARVAFMVRNFSECVEYVKEEIHEGFWKEV